MRLIDADKLDWWYKGRPIRRVIDDAPTVDAVPVVRCGECVNWQSGLKSSAAKDGTHFCSVTGRFNTGDGYCADGERRESEVQE